MQLTTAQLQALKADIAATPALAAFPANADGSAAIAKYYNELTTSVWVWRSAVSEADYTSRASVDGTTWSWPAYIARSQAERDAWARMFSAGVVSPAQANVRQGIADIFSGSTNGAPAQRAHLLACSRRLARRWEALLKTGDGTTTSPGTLSVEGDLTYDDIENARVS